MYACMYVCMYVYMYVCVCVYTYIHIYIYNTYIYVDMFLFIFGTYAEVEFLGHMVCVHSLIRNKLFSKVGVPFHVLSSSM